MIDFRIRCVLCGNAENLGGARVCELCEGTAVGEDGNGCEEDSSTTEGVLEGDEGGRVCDAEGGSTSCEGVTSSEVSDVTLLMALQIISCMSSSLSSRARTRCA